MDLDLERRIADLARRQHGVLTRPQLLRLGLRPAAIRRRVRCSRFRRLHRGVYLVGATMPPRAREMAAVLACGSTALLAGRSAGALLGLLPPPNKGVRVEVATLGAAQDRPGIRVHRVRRFDPGDRTRIDGIPVTSPARTLLDLARVLGPRELEQAVARAEHEGLVQPGELAAWLARRRGRPGARALRSVLERAGGPALTRSEAEERFLRLVRRAQLPPPDTNVKVDGCELDFLWPRHGIAVEVDGYGFHSSRPRFESDRRRIARMAVHGIQVIPVTWRQITEEATATMVRLGQALLRAELSSRRG